MAEEKSNFSAINKCAGEIVHCKACKGSYAKTFFFRHQANCRVNTQKDDNPAASTQATPDTGNTDDSFNDILKSFHRDDRGNMCRSDPTIKKIGKCCGTKIEQKSTKPMKFGDGFTAKPYKAFHRVHEAAGMCG